MFKVGDMVEFTLPDGNQVRHGRVARKEKWFYFIVGRNFIKRRVYRLRKKELRIYKGEKK